MLPIFNTIKIKVIIGLGNPDSNYRNTYHNVGCLFIDYLASRDLAKPDKLFKSDFFMNESGAFVKKIMKKHGLKSEELFVAHDDSDIQIGRYKISFGHGSAGHKGAESIIKNLKTSTKSKFASDGKNFWRLRIGVRSKIDLPIESASRRIKAGDFVLKKISAEDKKTLEKVFDQIGKVIFSPGN